MKTRIPLTAAVVGALAIGGAATGSTRASWTDQATQTGGAITAGRLSYTASTPAGVTIEKSATSVADALITVDDTSLGKNIAQRITATIGSTPAGVTATVGTTCDGATNFIDTTPASADQTFCVRVTSSPSAVSGNVTVNLSSAQRPVAGWATPPVNRTVEVTVPAAQAPPAPTCSGTGGSIQLSWPGRFPTHSGDYQVRLTWGSTSSVTYTVSTTSLVLSAPPSSDTSNKDVSITISRIVNGQPVAPATGALQVKWNNGNGWRCS